MQYYPEIIEDPEYSWLALRMQDGNITNNLERYIYEALWGGRVFKSLVPFHLWDFEYAQHLRDKYDRGQLPPRGNTGLKAKVGESVKKKPHKSHIRVDKPKYAY
jgi:hypothetical protein